jgi:hypothetical protein
MHRSPWLPIAIAVALFALPQVAAAQEQPTPREGHACPAGEECPMPPDHEAMKARHEVMMKQHEEGAARMQELQDGMHAATGEAKVDAIAALLDEMLAQQRAMHEMMMGEHPMMMDHDGMKHEGMEADDDDL